MSESDKIDYRVEVATQENIMHIGVQPPLPEEWQSEIADNVGGVYKNRINIFSFNVPQTSRAEPYTELMFYIDRLGKKTAELATISVLKGIRQILLQKGQNVSFVGTLEKLKYDGDVTLFRK
ncbi:MAG TPA: hypothetical protein VLF90_00035 [Patescibacteria group bacterium]|nr:hypothetical protein [Patescibacteria group bacterium]